MSDHSLSCSLFGLPNVGKSTLFNILTESCSASAENFPFCTILPNIGIVEVPDTRLNRLAEVSNSKKVVPCAIKLVDVAGLVQGAHKGAGLGNQFLAHVRETDLMIQVVRCFSNPDTVHVLGRVDPVSDAEIIHTECVLADLHMAQECQARYRRRSNAPDYASTMACLDRVIAALEEGIPLRDVDFPDGENVILSRFPFLTLKRLILAANVDENHFTSKTETFDNLEKYARMNRLPIVPFCASLEAELLDIPLDNRKEFLEYYGLHNSSLEILIREAFSRLGLISFFTSGEQETRSWAIREETLAPQAAGRIHTDLQKGFIRAEVILYKDFIASGGRVQAREEGKARQVGKDYRVQEGDVILFFHKI